MMNRNEAYNLLKQYLKNSKLIKHSLAVEAIMRGIAQYIEEDVELWSRVGLLHDLDYEYTEGHPEKHANISADILTGMIPEKGINAIKAHNYLHTDYIPTTSIDKALLAADAISGLIIATALIMPTKKINDVKEYSLINKYNDKSFAKGCNRNKINLCLDIGIKLNDFISLSLNSLKEISKELDL
jgi:putative nucleotidyltransferase with HDIG domain